MPMSATRSADQNTLNACRKERGARMQDEPPGRPLRLGKATKPAGRDPLAGREPVG